MPGAKPDGERDAAPAQPEPVDAGTCGASPFAAATVPANVLFLIDKSTSMLESISKDDATQKWTALQQGLAATLPQVADRINVGLAVYPTVMLLNPIGGEACADDEEGEVRLPIKQGKQAAQDALIELAAVTPVGGTPTASALTRALRYFTEQAATLPSGEKYVVLATDGGPNCNEALSCDADECLTNLNGSCTRENCCDPLVSAESNLNCLDDDRTLDAVKALAKAHVRTIVIGIPGSEAFAEVLDALAVAGGVPNLEGDRKYYAVTGTGVGTGGLTGVLDRVTQALIRSCTLQLGSVPPSLNKLNVTIDGDVIARDDPDGWRLDEATDPPTVVLQGATCEAIESEGAREVGVTFGCPTIVIQ